MKRKTETSRLLRRVLKNLGCSCKRDDSYITFKYQGLYFYVAVDEDGDTIVIFIPIWNTCSSKDATMMEMFKRSVNAANMVTHTSTCYTPVEFEGNSRIDIYSIKRIPFVPEIPDIEEYLSDELDNFFYSQRRFDYEMECFEEEGLERERKGKSRPSRSRVQFAPSDFLLEILDSYGLEYEINDSGCVFSHYQGITFQMACIEGSRYLTVYNFSWKIIEIHDEKQLDSIKSAINEVNGEVAVVSFYLMNEGEHGTCVELCCSKQFIFMPEIPNIDIYFLTVLEGFVTAHEMVESIIQSEQPD